MQFSFALVGNSAGGASSTVTRSSVTSNNRTQSNRRISHQRHQPNQLQSATPLASFSGVIARNSDDLGTRSISSQDVCDNSNDSGLGFEERQQLLNKATVSSQSTLCSNLKLPPTKIIYGQKEFDFCFALC